MNDATVKKVSEKSAPKGSMDQTYLVSGKRVAMRLWEPFTAVRRLRRFMAETNRRAVRTCWSRNRWRPRRMKS
jgi:hypothetical protein